MRNLKQTTIINCLVFIVAFSIYFVVFSGGLYNPPPFLELYYPVGITLFAILFLGLNIILKQNVKIIIVTTILSGILFVLATSATDNFFGNIFRGFYSNYHNIIELPHYLDERNKRILVNDLILKKGLEINNVVDGKSLIENGVTQNIKYYYVFKYENQKTYNSYYVLVDFDKQAIIDFIALNKLANEHLEKLKTQNDFKAYQNTVIGNDTIDIYYLNYNKETVRYRLRPVITKDKIDFKVE